MKTTVAVWRDVAFKDSQWTTVSRGDGPRYKIIATGKGWYAENESGKELTRYPQWLGHYAQQMHRKVLARIDGN